MHLQDQQIYSVTNSQCSDVCWVVHQSENDYRKWTELHCAWVTVFLAPVSKSLCIFFDTYVRLLFINDAFVCLFHITKHWHSAILKSSLMHVLLWSWAVSRIDSVKCLNEAYSHLHLHRERFKWCVCEKSFSHLWVEDFEHMNCCRIHAYFSMCLIYCYSTSSYILIDDHKQRNFLLLKWLEWVDNVSHNLCDMISVRLFYDDDYDSWLSELMSEIVFSVRYAFKKASIVMRQLLYKLVHFVVLIDVAYFSFSKLIFWIQMIHSLL